MAKVIAVERGYYGGMVRDPLELGPGSLPFEIPDEIWNDEKLRPSWVRLVKAPAEAAAEGTAAVEPEPAKPKRKAKAEAATAEPFADASLPQAIAISNELGQTEPTPDWVAQAGADI